MSKNKLNLHSVMWRILLIIAMAYVYAIVDSTVVTIAPGKYDMGVVFVLGWWCALIWNKMYF